MIVEYLNDYRDFWSFSRIWKIFEYLDEIRVHDFSVFAWFSRISIILKFIIPPLPPICNASQEGNWEAYFRRFEWISSIWMIFEILIYFRVFVWLFRFRLIFEFLNLLEVLNNFLFFQNVLRFWIFEFFKISNVWIFKNLEFLKIELWIFQNFEILNMSKFWIFQNFWIFQFLKFRNFTIFY